MKLCPWSGAPCCGCCPQGPFPWKVDGKIPIACSAWREWTLRTFAALIPKPRKPK